MEDQLGSFYKEKLDQAMEATRKQIEDYQKYGIVYYKLEDFQKKFGVADWQTKDDGFWNKASKHMRKVSNDQAQDLFAALHREGVIFHDKEDPYKGEWVEVRQAQMVKDYNAEVERKNKTKAVISNLKTVNRNPNNNPSFTKKYASPKKAAKTPSELRRQERRAKERKLNEGKKIAFAQPQ